VDNLPLRMPIIPNTPANSEYLGKTFQADKALDAYVRKNHAGINFNTAELSDLIAEMVADGVLTKPRAMQFKLEGVKLAELDAKLSMALQAGSVAAFYQQAKALDNLGQEAALEALILKFHKEALDTNAFANKEAQDKMRAALSEFVQINGQDAYSNQAIAIGFLKVTEYLALPRGFVVPETLPADVGSGKNQEKYTFAVLAQIYVLNKARCPTAHATFAVKYGMVRMEAVKMGWVANQREITFVDVVADAISVFIADMQANQDDVTSAKMFAFTVPFMCEHTFRVTSHHYISGQSADYKRRYDQLFSACLVINLRNFMPDEVSFHHALHWVSPGRVWAVIMALKDTDRLPEAINIRCTAAPSGTALVTTTNAVLDMMDASGVLATLPESKKTDVRSLRDLTFKIRSNPVRYHKTHQAYGLPELPDAEKIELNEAKMMAMKLAPITQGFIDAMLKNAALGRAKALEKHAEGNPLLRKKAAKYFKALAKNGVKEFNDLFAEALAEAISMQAE